MESLRFGRRTAFRAAGASVVALALLSSCTAHAPDYPILPSTTSVFVPNWLSAADYTSIEQRLGSRLGNIGRLYIAFAVPDGSGTNLLLSDTGNKLPDGMTQLIDAMPKRTRLALSIGGAGIKAANWHAAATNAIGFGKTADQLRRQIEQQFQRPTDLDLDCEANGMSANEITTLAHALRDNLPTDRTFSMDVPADYNLGQFDMRASGLPSSVQLFNVMAYDKHTQQGEKKAGVLADGPWVINAVAKWVHTVGDARRVAVGYAAYGRNYPGAHQAGDTFGPIKKPAQSEIPYYQIPANAIHDNPAALTSYALMNTAESGGNAWVTFMSPAMIRETNNRLLNQHPDLGGNFYWDASGMVPEHLDAVAH